MRIQKKPEKGTKSEREKGDVLEIDTFGDPK
jgi:hypothetical protein